LVEQTFARFAVEIEHAGRLASRVIEPRQTSGDVNPHAGGKRRLPDAGVADEEMPRSLAQQAGDNEVIVRRSWTVLLERRVIEHAELAQRGEVEAIGGRDGLWILIHGWGFW